MRALVIEARFYDDLLDELSKGAAQALEAEGVSFDVVAVPGALEIPAAVAIAADTGSYELFVALGVVIRGETSHFDIVAGESARALMDLAVTRSLCIGNGILTCDTAEQAWRRARVSELNKGGAAAIAALSMARLKRKLAGLSV